MNISKRISEPTPKFWKKIGRIGLIIGGAAGGLLALPVVLPAAVITGLTVAAGIGGTLVTVSKLAVNEEPDNKQIKP